MYQFIFFIWTILRCSQKFYLFLKSTSKLALIRVSCGLVFFCSPFIMFQAIMIDFKSDIFDRIDKYWRS